MKTIDIIIKKHGYTKQFLLDCEKEGICNGMGGKGGIQWTDKLRKLKGFKSKKKKKLLIDLDLISDIHDLSFNKGGGVKDFFTANYQLAINILKLLHWTTVTGRTTIFCLVFFGTSTLGIRYFNFTKVL